MPGCGAKAAVLGDRYGGAKLMELHPKLSSHFLR
jgi:hypothetical protein